MEEDNESLLERVTAEAAALLHQNGFSDSPLIRRSRSHTSNPQPPQPQPQPELQPQVQVPTTVVRPPKASLVRKAVDDESRGLEERIKRFNAKLANRDLSYATIQPDPKRPKLDFSIASASSSISQPVANDENACPKGSLPRSDKASFLKTLTNSTAGLGGSHKTFGSLLTNTKRPGGDLAKNGVFARSALASYRQKLENRKAQE